MLLVQMCLVDLYSTKLMLKNIEKCNQFKQRNVSVFRDYMFNKTQLMFLKKSHVIGANVFGWSLQYLFDAQKHWKLCSVQTKKRLGISWLHIYENATNVFSKVRCYWCKCVWLISTVLNWCSKTLKNVINSNKETFSYFVTSRLRKRN